MLPLTTHVSSVNWRGINFSRGQPQGPRDTTYLEFSETRPSLFVKAEEPLEADEWVRVMEQKFGRIRCTETQKPLFAAQ
jgi:hypothetical protein